jgi:hypothetical protein
VKVRKSSRVEVGVERVLELDQKQGPLRQRTRRTK